MAGKYSPSLYFAFVFQLVTQCNGRYMECFNAQKECNKEKNRNSSVVPCKCSTHSRNVMCTILIKLTIKKQKITISIGTQRIIEQRSTTHMLSEVMVLEFQRFDTEHIIVTLNWPIQWDITIRNVVSVKHLTSYMSSFANKNKPVFTNPFWDWQIDRSSCIQYLITTRTEAYLKAFVIPN